MIVFIIFSSCKGSVYIILTHVVNIKSKRLYFTPLIKKYYELYFGCKVSDTDKSWAPNICHVTCVRLLTGQVNGSRHIPFAIPMVWREPNDHSSHCYFCLTNIMGITPTSKYTKISKFVICNEACSTHWTVACNKAYENLAFSNDNSDSDIDHGQQEGDYVDCDLTFEASSFSSEPHLLTQRRS